MAQNKIPTPGNYPEENIQPGISSFYLCLTDVKTFTGRCNPKQMHLNASRFLNFNDISWILFADSIGLHRVENLSNINPAVSLHLYSPPYSSCQVFNELTGQSTLAKVTFWSKFGEKRDKVSFKILLTIKYKVWLLELQFNKQRGQSMSTKLTFWSKFAKERNRVT
jgi:hypothetical protein